MLDAIITPLIIISLAIGDVCGLYMILDMLFGISDFF